MNSLTNSYFILLISHAKISKMRDTNRQYNNSIHSFSWECWKIAFHEFLEIDKIGKTGESTKSFFPAYLWISLDNISVWSPSITGLGKKNLLYEIKICNKAIIKSQRQFICGSNIYGSDFTLTVRSMHFQFVLPLHWWQLATCEFFYFFFLSINSSFYFFKDWKGFQSYAAGIIVFQKHSVVHGTRILSAEFWWECRSCEQWLLLRVKASILSLYKSHWVF